MVALLPHHSRVMICFSLQCTNRQLPFSPCLLTNLHVFTAACSVSFSFCYSSSVSRVLYIPCPMPSSRFSLAGLLLLSRLPFDRSLALFNSAHENPPSPQCFPFFPLSPEVYATAFLFYLISRLVLDAFSSLAPPQRSAVFSLTPLVDSESRFPTSRSCTYIPSIIPSLLFSFFPLSFYIFSFSPLVHNADRPHLVITSTRMGRSLRSWLSGTFTASASISAIHKALRSYT